MSRSRECKTSALYQYCTVARKEGRKEKGCKEYASSIVCRICLAHVLPSPWFRTFSCVISHMSKASLFHVHVCAYWHQFFHGYSQSTRYWYRLCFRSKNFHVYIRLYVFHLLDLVVVSTTIWKKPTFFNQCLFVTYINLSISRPFVLLTQTLGSTACDVSLSGSNYWFWHVFQIKQATQNMS